MASIQKFISKNFVVHLIEIMMLIFLFGHYFVAAKQFDQANTITESYEFVNDTSIANLSTAINGTDGKKSDNLHLLTRIYERLHEIHNRHHHHHLHHLGRGGSSLSSTIFGDRPFNRLFRNRQMDRSEMDYDRPDSFERFDRPYNRRFNRGQWSGRKRRRKRQIDYNLDNSLDDFLEHFSYKKSSLNQFTTSPPYLSHQSSFYNSSSSFTTPSVQTLIHPQYRTTHPDILSQTKSYQPSVITTTTPTSISLTTTSFYSIDPINITHHYYHQAYLLYKYFKIYKDKNINEIHWTSLPDDVRDKFKMLMLSLKFTQSKRPANGHSATNTINISDEIVISKALEIVKWKGWEFQEKYKRKDTKLVGDFKPMITVNHHHNIKSAIKEPIKDLSDKTSFKDSTFQRVLPKNLAVNRNSMNVQNSSDRFLKSESKQITQQYSASPFEKQYTTNQINPIDQLDDIDSNTISTPDIYSNINLSNTYSPVYQPLIDTTTLRPLTTTMSSNEELKRAFENIEDIRINHSCSKPRGRLFGLKEFNQDYRFLLPKSVYLHKCDNQAGCCSKQSQNCVPSEQEMVVKYFYNLSSNKKQNRVVRLEFVNDTRCQCRDTEKQLNEQNNGDDRFRPIYQNSIKSINKLVQSQLAPNYSILISTSSPIGLESSDHFKTNDLDKNYRIKIDDSFNQKDHLESNQYTPNRHTNSNNQQIFSHQIQLNGYDTSNMIRTDEANDLQSMDKQTNLFFHKKKFTGKLTVQHYFDCNSITICPEPYTVALDRSQSNQCYCGCKSKNVNCIKVMNGLLSLNEYQINCVRSGQCQLPECLFKSNDLDYNKNTGLCPSKEDLIGIY